jgi:hypothetical protein
VGEKNESKIRLELTPAQRKKIRQETGKDVVAVELTGEELDGQIALAEYPIARLLVDPRSRSGGIEK